MKNEGCQVAAVSKVCKHFVMLHKSLHNDGTQNPGRYERDLPVKGSVWMV
jgi:hypothetical protein